MQGCWEGCSLCGTLAYSLHVPLQDVAAYRAKGGSGKSDAGKKSGPGRPPAKKAQPADDDDDDEDEDDEEEDEDDDEDDD